MYNNLRLKKNEHFDLLMLEKQQQMDQLVVMQQMIQHQIMLIVLNKYPIKIEPIEKKYHNY
jgi:hypothetical protein